MPSDMFWAHPSPEGRERVQNIPVPSSGPVLYADRFKRALDIVIVLLAAPVAVIVVGLLGLIIMADGMSPFFMQDRVGRHGRLFRMLKLRSMVADAETRLQAHLETCPKARIEWQVNQKLRRDPRITRIGRIIRKTSLDELPQLWNVLVGDMSIVGPRPMMPSQQSLYPGIAYYAMRPGITGYWQISVRNESSFAERAQFDARYFRDLSLLTDLRVMLRTFGVVMRGTGC
ncbi:putative sugar transferase EpsL [Roseovarius sp. A-2]|uniref:sugar transferase n=1 Tax=Roseovarius sp. A-2 TaxID=1570360 RepID=UPI0009B58F76|nr:sugar transferase [Roseovarius sp. A-2]GAW33768.1 putative sugar transferase EpsL [Roseovarius sp. A-2]